MPRIDRLLTGCDFIQRRGKYKGLPRIPKEKVNLSEFVNDCGTVMCAAGWMATCPQLKGFSIAPRGSSPGLTLKSGNRWGWAALEHYFDLTWQASEELFNHYDDITLDDVARRIRAFCKKEARHATH